MFYKLSAQPNDLIMRPASSFACECAWYYLKVGKNGNGELPYAEYRVALEKGIVFG